MNPITRRKVMSRKTSSVHQRPYGSGPKCIQQAVGAESTRRFESAMGSRGGDAKTKFRSNPEFISPSPEDTGPLPFLFDFAPATILEPGGALVPFAALVLRLYARVDREELLSCVFIIHWSSIIPLGSVGGPRLVWGAGSE